MNKQILTAIAVAFALTLSAPSAYAGSSGGSQVCQPIYGGGESCVQSGQITINKVVQDPQSKNYVENLNINDAKFAPGQTVNFKITISNKSNTKISNIVLKDILPEFVTFIQAPGNFDANTKTLTLKIDSLNANESRDFFVQGKIVNKETLPADQDIICLVNQATVSMESKVSQDNAQFCIKKEVQTTKGGLQILPPTTAKSTPSTGAESLALIGLIPSALGGIMLRRKAK